MRPSRLLRLACLTTCIVGGAAHADDQSAEDRLREALRQSVTEMRAAQDNAAQLQAQLTTAQQAQQSLQAQLDAANAKLAGGTAKPEQLKQMQASLEALKAQNAALQAGLGKWQGAYQTAADLARAKNAEAAQATTGLKRDSTALETCETANKKLIGVSEDVLHLYETQSFRSILLKSYEPLIGSAKVDLENLVQDYDDKIQNQAYFPPKASP